MSDKSNILHTVTFVDNEDGSIVSLQVVEHGCNAREPLPKFHDHKILSSWIGDYENITEDRTISAVYANAYEVTFIDSFNDHVISKTLVANGKKAIAPEIPTYKTFIGLQWDVDLNEVHNDILTRPIYLDATNMLKNVIGHYTISNLKDIMAILNSLYNIFTWIPGERILLPEFGSNLRQLLYEGITDFNVERIMAEIRHCVSEWEPRVLIDNVINIGTVDDTEDNTVHLQIIYTIPGLTTDKFVYDLDYNKE